MTFVVVGGDPTTTKGDFTSTAITRNLMITKMKIHRISKRVCVVVLFCIACIFVMSLAQNVAHSNDLTCHDPDAGGTVQNNDRRFLIIGSDNSSGAGLGNLLIFFPAAYYFAAFTGRDIIISDQSTIGEMCRVVKCGFPFASEMILAYPGILSEESVKQARSIKKGDMISHMEGKYIDDLVVRAWGYKPESDWWVYFNETVQCVTKITQCDVGDVTCAERHAFQRLIRGPFISKLTADEEERVHGVPKNVKHAILSLPHSFSPRFDAAIHLRTQFQSFENQENLNSTSAKEEVANWLSSDEGKTVFAKIEEKLLEEIGKDRIHRHNISMHHGVHSPLSANQTSSDPIYVYLAADNEEVKEALANELETKHIEHFDIKVMRVRTNGIVHVKNLAKMKKLTNDEGVMDMVFDWYALSLANVVMAWRKGGTHLISTFVHSAQRLSGTTMRTSHKKDFGKNGMGTIGLQLQTKHNNWNWNPFWTYGFMEDFAKPDDRKRLRKLMAPLAQPIDDNAKQL